MAKSAVKAERTLWRLFALIFFVFFAFSNPVNASSSSRDYDAIIQTVSAKYNIEAPLIHSIVRAESNYNCRALSPKGAAGLMQLMPETAQVYGVNDRFDPRENIEGGVKYLKDLVRLFDGKTELVLAAYNAGQEAVKKYKGIPPYPETKAYIQKVKALYGKSTIRTKTEIYKFYDKNGRFVLTNDRNLYFMNRPNTRKSSGSK